MRCLKGVGIYLCLIHLLHLCSLRLIPLRLRTSLLSPPRLCLLRLCLLLHLHLLPICWHLLLPWLVFCFVHDDGGIDGGVHVEGRECLVA